jgi:hypothetical protein
MGTPSTIATLFKVSMPMDDLWFSMRERYDSERLHRRANSLKIQFPSSYRAGLQLQSVRTTADAQVVQPVAQGAHQHRDRWRRFGDNGNTGIPRVLDWWPIVRPDIHVQRPEAMVQD